MNVQPLPQPTPVRATDSRRDMQQASEDDHFMREKNLFIEVEMRIKVEVRITAPVLPLPPLQFTATASLFFAACTAKCQVLNLEY